MGDAHCPAWWPKPHISAIGHVVYVVATAAAPIHAIESAQVMSNVSQLAHVQLICRLHMCTLLLLGALYVQQLQEKLNQTLP